MKRGPRGIAPFGSAGLRAYIAREANVEAEGGARSGGCAAAINPAAAGVTAATTSVRPSRAGAGSADWTLGRKALVQ